MQTIVAVAVASALGGLCRYLLGGWLARPGASFPWETLVVNASGTLALGFLFTVLIEQATVAGWVRSALLVGFLGSYTTFSTFSLESFRLIEDGAVGLAIANLLGSVAAGLVAVYAGIVVARTIA